MRVHLASILPDARHSNVEAFIELAAHSSRHTVAVSPDEADVVLFTDCHLQGWDWRMRALRRNPLLRAHREKAYVYDERDRPWCALPGLYVSMPSGGFTPAWQISTSYSLVEQPWRRVGEPALRQVEPDLLFSFVGSRTHPCRDALQQLAGTPGSVIETVADGFTFFDPASTRFEEHRQRFARVLYRSLFVLCPRGVGTSSIRLYEAIAAGRCPVIISDDWVAPLGPDWAAFSIRWPEARIEELPGVLEERAADAVGMGVRARDAYEKWFAREVWFDRCMDALEELHTSRRGQRFPSGGVKKAGFVQAARFGIGARARVRAGRAKLMIRGRIERDRHPS